MAVYFPFCFSIYLSFLISRTVGCSGAFFSCINNPHPASQGEHYARNAQIKPESATLFDGIMGSDSQRRDAAKHRSGLMP
jgi:hypothetical protein